MLTFLVLCVLLAYTEGQLLTAALQDKLDNTIDLIHGWRLEDHITHDYHILLFIRDLPDQKYCYVFEVGRRWEGELLDQAKVELIAEEIYHVIMDPNHREADIMANDLLTVYSDFDAARECQGHATHRMRYTPSWISAGPGK